MKRIKGLFLIFALVLTAIAVSAGSALANTAANTQIVNFAKLTYTGGSAQATVTVTVALKPSAPNVTISYGNSAYTGPNNPAIIDTVTITSTANGPASYTVSPSIPAGGTSNVQLANPASVNAPAPTVTIGASVTTGTSGLTYVTVPSGLASGNNSAVNGIGVGSTILFTVNGTTYNRVVSSTTDNGNGTFAINWATAIGALDAPPAGTQIAEQKQVNVNVLPGTVQNTGSDLTVIVTADVTTAGAGTVTVTTAQPNKWTTPSPNVSITKYVRNFSDESIVGTKGATSLTINTVTKTYYTEGVTAKPGQTLEYVVVATNTGITDLNNSALSDQIPVAYVDFVTGSYGGKEVFYIDPNNGTTSFTAAGVGANQASFVAGNTPNLVVNVGNGATSALTGTIPAGKSVTIAYRVAVK